MKSPFGEPCPWPKCSAPIVRSTGDEDDREISVRCENDHRSVCKRSARKLELEPDRSS